MKKKVIRTIAQFTCVREEENQFMAILLAHECMKSMLSLRRTCMPSNNYEQFTFAIKRAGIQSLPELLASKHSKKTPEDRNKQSNPTEYEMEKR